MQRTLFFLLLLELTVASSLAAHRQYDIYLVGRDTNWSFQSDHRLSYQGDGVYHIDCSNLTFCQEFKIATSDWKTIDLGGASLLPDTPVAMTWKGSNIPYPTGWKIKALTLTLAEDLSSYTLLCTSASLVSGTLPVLHIQTYQGQPISSTSEYITATYWQEGLSLEGQEDIGRADSTLELKIRGRGNWTWSGFDKKPYRIKLEKKAALGGLRKAKNFCLMARADDNLGYLRDEVGFEVSRRMGMPWTPECRPVELVLNGAYAGLYFVTEPVRIGEHHVNIVPQAEKETAPDSITGGWLMEIDNYQEEHQIRITEGNGEKLCLKYHDPEELSTEQYNWIAIQMQTLNRIIYSTDKNSTDWELYIDKDALVRYYLVNEVMEDTESFHGSCYFYRDRGDTALWTWGPVWDFGNAFRVMKNRFIYDGPEFTQYWIGEMSKWSSFQMHLREVWQEWLADGWPGLTEWIDLRASILAAAARYDASRWPEYGAADMEAKANAMKQNLEWRMQWLIRQWGERSELDHPISVLPEPAVQSFDLLGRPVSATAPGWKVRHDGKRQIIR